MGPFPAERSASFLWICRYVVAERDFRGDRSRLRSPRLLRCGVKRGYVDEPIWLTILIFLAAALYSSVGYAGASGYLAAMAFAGLAPETMRPAALALNILVASIATYRYARAGHFAWRTFYPFALSSVPFAFLGGSLQLPSHV